MREKMSRNSRARQFLPFDAMKGLREAIRAAEFENESVLHHRLSEDEAKRISAILSSLNAGDAVYVKYFADSHYFEEKGPCKLDVTRSILVVNEVEIPLFDIYDLKLLD